LKERRVFEGKKDFEGKNALKNERSGGGSESQGNNARASEH
jgi:hypothetical protein